MINVETLLSTAVGESLTLTNTLAVIFSSIILGLIISMVYIKTHKKEGYAPSFSVTLIMLPTIISIIILLVGNNVARAFSLAGAFSLIRFRSAPGDPKDIAYVFFTLAVGLASGMGYVGYAAIFTIILCAVMIIITMTNYGVVKNTSMILKITVPENLNYQHLFDDILNEFTLSHHLKKVKTSNFGELFEIVYHIEMKNETDQKKFIDELRCRNGNLNISLTISEFEDKVYA